MRVEFFIHDAQGRLLRRVSCDEEHADFQVGEGESAIQIEDGVDVETHYLDLSSDIPDFIRIPARPSPQHAFDFATKTWVADVTAVEGAARTLRQSLLTSSDWTQLPDVPIETKTAWAVYRQALRDITDQPGFPTEIQWPVRPA